MSNAKSFEFVRFGFFPIGKLLSKRSLIATDPVTAKGVSQFQNHMLTGTNGALVFFAHLGLIDLFSTAAVLDKVTKYKGIFPVAASWYYFPVLRQIFEALHQQVRHKYYPVYRKEDLGTSPDNIEMLNISKISYSQKRTANKKYIMAAQQLLQQPRGAVILNPYGGRGPQFKYFRSGISQLVSKDIPVICSLTKWSWKSFSYEIYFSELKYFDSDDSAKYLHKEIYSQFYRMAQLSGISESELIHAKGHSTITLMLWNSIARALKFLAYKIT